MGPMKPKTIRLAVAFALSTTGFGLLVAGVAVTLGSGPALLIAGGVLLAIGLLSVGIK